MFSYRKNINILPFIIQELKGRIFLRVEKVVFLGSL